MIIFENIKAQLLLSQTGLEAIAKPLATVTCPVVINRGARGGAAAPGAILNCLDSISQDVASEPRRRLLKVPLRVL